MALSDSEIESIEALIAVVDALDMALVDGAYEVPAPDPTAEPTQDDVEAASATVVALETRRNAIRAELATLQSLRLDMAYYYGRVITMEEPNLDDAAAVTAYFAQMDLVRRHYAARYRLGRYVEELVSAEQLVVQLCDQWNSALAVLEHDLKWQAYVAEAFGATENPRRAAALDQKAAA